LVRCGDRLPGGPVPGLLEHRLARELRGGRPGSNEADRRAVRWNARREAARRKREPREREAGFTPRGVHETAAHAASFVRRPRFSGAFRAKSAGFTEFSRENSALNDGIRADLKEGASRIGS